MSILPEAKVTIVIEDLEGNFKKIVIPLASKPDYGVVDMHDLETGHLADEKHFGFGCYALYDIDQNLVADEQRMTKTQYEDDIIDQARDILQRRWSGPQAVLLDTTSINVVKGEN